MEQRRLASTEWVDIVNEENEVIAQASREQMRAQCLRHRATYIVVHDGMGKILVQRRTETKDFLPGMLDATAGGVVQADEQLLLPGQGSHGAAHPPDVRVMKIRLVGRGRRIGGIGALRVVQGQAFTADARALEDIQAGVVRDAKQP